ncbi:MAG: hypothetical protein AAGC80_18985 [Rhodococcus sp. (in: high G+C Gram-positive bacteria)]
MGTSVGNDEVFTPTVPDAIRHVEHLRRIRGHRIRSLHLQLALPEWMMHVASATFLSSYSIPINY